MCALHGMALERRQSVELLFFSGTGKVLARSGWHFHVSPRSHSQRSPFRVSRLTLSPIFFPAPAGNFSSLWIMNGVSSEGIAHTGGQYGSVLHFFSVTLRRGRALIIPPSRFIH